MNLLDSQFRYRRLGLALLNLISTTKDGLENQTLNDDLAWCWKENCSGKCASLNALARILWT